MTEYLIFLFTLTLYCPVLVSPLIPYNTKFVQRGFIERAAFEDRVPALHECNQVITERSSLRNLLVKHEREQVER
jgi:hypothetical protein